MGTSTSSSGPGAGVPLVPPWVQVGGPDQVAPRPNQSSENSPSNPSEAPATPQVPVAGQTSDVVLAPPRRFAGARRGVGRFAQTGESGDLKRGLGHYVRGIGGGAQGVRRMATTVRTANALFNTLSALRSGQTAGLDLGGVNPASLAGRPAKEVMDVIIEAIRPNDGTQDSEANRMSIASATADLLIQFPNIDLTALTLDQINLLIERYVAQDLCQRLELDIGRTVQSRAPTAAEAIRRLDAIKDFINAEVQSQFTARRARGEHFQRNQVSKLVEDVMLDVFYVFEGYLL